MFVLNKELQLKKVWIYRELLSGCLVDYILIKEGNHTTRLPCFELPKNEAGIPVVKFQSAKTGKMFYWYLSDIYWNQFKGQIPDDCFTGFIAGNISEGSLFLTPFENEEKKDKPQSALAAALVNAGLTTTTEGV